MKKFSCFCLALLMLLLTGALASCGAKNTVPSGMQDATSKGVSAYSLYVPQTWVVDPIGVMSMAHHPTDTTCSISVSDFSAEEEEKDAASYWNNLKEKYAASLPGFTVTSEGNGFLGGKAAGIYSFTVNMGNTAVSYQQVISLVGRKAYILTYSAPTELFDSHLEDFTSVQTEFVFR